MEGEAAPQAPQGPTNVLSLHVLEFMGKREEFAVFLRCLEMEFAMNPIKYAADFVKIAFTLNKMMKDYAAEWAMQASALTLATPPPTKPIGLHSEPNSMRLSTPSRTSPLLSRS